MKNIYCTIRYLSALAITALAQTAATPASACMSYELNSVHFNADKPDFGRPPRRGAITSHYEHGSRPVAEEISGFYDHFELDRERDKHKADKRAVEVARGMTAAEALSVVGQWRQARAIYEGLDRRFGPSGNLRDLSDTMNEAERAAGLAGLSPTLSRALATYLKGMAAYEDGKHAESRVLFDALCKDTPPASEADFLRARALYQKASLAYEWLDFPRAVDLYQQLLREYPHCARREAALIMIARSGILPATDEGRRLEDGRTALAALRKDYPTSRFLPAAAGLQARIDTLNERYAPALRSYLALGDLDSVEEVCRSLSGPALHRGRAELLAACMRRLITAPTFKAYENAIAGIDRTKRNLAREEITLFHKRVLNDPATAAGYLYYRLNHTPGHAADTKRLAALAETLTARYRVAKLPALLQVEIAEIHYHQGQYGRAAEWASRCLRQYRDYDRALYVRGAARHKLKLLPQAAADFATLLRDCPKSGLRAGAHEEAALVAENADDWGTALAHYFALEYRLDVAYLLDVRMTPAQIEAYLKSPDAAQQCSLPVGWRGEENAKPIVCRRSELAAFALGIRYLRNEKWDTAAQWLKRVPAGLSRRLGRGRADWDGGHPSPDPLTAVRELRALDLAARRARGVKARGDALFRYGSYYYTHGTLLLYNPALWQGQREVGFGMWWNDRALSKQDAELVRAYMYEHESYARSEKICLSAFERYPSSPTAPQALYRAACAARKLASFNAWWREENHHNNQWIKSIRMMKQFVRRYPRHPLANEARKYARVFNDERKGSW